MPQGNNRDDPPKFAKYTVVVTCVLIRKTSGGHKRAIILRRSTKESEGPGLWTIPGGRLKVCDWGKGARLRSASHQLWVGILSRAIKREIMEETGIRVNRVVFLHGREKVFLRKDGTPTLVLVFRASAGSKARAKIGKESIGLCWVSKRELGRYEFIGNVRSDILAAFEK